MGLDLEKLYEKLKKELGEERVYLASSGDELYVSAPEFEITIRKDEIWLYHDVEEQLIFYLTNDRHITPNLEALKTLYKVLKAIFEDTLP